MRGIAYVTAAVLLAIGIGVGVEAATSGGGEAAARTLTLTCSDSAGQQGRGDETVTGGVEGLLPGSGDPAALTPIEGPDGKHYFVYKAFLGVSPADAPYATVSIVSPLSARLYYGPSSRVGELASTAQGRGIVSAAQGQVRLPVCGPAFTGFVGGIIVTAAERVTLAVSSPGKPAVQVTVPIGVT